MFGLGKSGKLPLAGLDISSAAIKLIQISRSGDRFQVDGYAVRPLPENVVVDGKVNDYDLVGNAIRAAAAGCPVPPKHVAVAIPSGLVINKVIQMPIDMTDGEIETQLSVDADQHIPHNIDEVSLDFVMRGENAKNPAQRDVLLAACRKEYVDDREAAVESAGLAVRVVDIDTYAMCRAFELFAPRSSWARIPWWRSWTLGLLPRRSPCCMAARSFIGATSISVGAS